MSLELIKPKALKVGSRIAVVSPASVAEHESVSAGESRLRGLGYEVVSSPHLFYRNPINRSGTISDRVMDLHGAFADEAVHGILCVRGGWGSAELLPFLDAKLIRSNAKPFIGYSDQTSLHIWLRKFAGMVSFHGPMCASDFARQDGVDLGSWKHALHEQGRWSIGKREGLRVLKEGVAEGILDGGCLSIFVEGLGTPYAPESSRGFLSLESSGILFLEDVGTKPYQWDRQLLHLRYAGQFEQIRGVVLGDMRQCVPESDQQALEKAIVDALRDFKGPVAIGLRSGHVDGANVTIPLGVKVRLDLGDGSNPRLEFLEAAVRE